MIKAVHKGSGLGKSPNYSNTSFNFARLLDDKRIDRCSWMQHRDTKRRLKFGLRFNLKSELKIQSAQIDKERSKYIYTGRKYRQLACNR